MTGRGPFKENQGTAMATTHGGKRPGAGRPAGKKSALTVAHARTLAEIARDHTPAAIQCLVDVMMGSTSDSARISAANSILDRGHGKAIQTVETTQVEDAAPIRLSIEVREAVGNVRVTEPVSPASDLSPRA
jgi:hypothetical protein